MPVETFVIPVQIRVEWRRDGKEERQFETELTCDSRESDVEVPACAANKGNEKNAR